MRIISLVPSATETLLALGRTPVACTRFCEQPGIDTVGGTKDPDIDRIARLEPDLVVVNDEENRFDDVDRLRRLGVAVHEMSPRSVAEVGPAVAALAGAVGADPPAPFGRAEWAGWLGARRRERDGRPRRTFVAVWRRPWMTLSGDTYGSSLLELLGCSNVFASGAPAGPPGSAGAVRYPTIELADAAARTPDLVLLPTEPYPFKERHVAEVAAGVPGAAVEIVDGQDLFWWGIRTPGAVERLAGTLSGSRHR
ncbi:MAG TPA: helical backbone metal receptor [Acidimicrobiia bacterium]|nr:helical backbone metal receptor [Acidimicrobiia bacterium]